MQSFLQYRRFGRHVGAQYERDKKKAKVQQPSDGGDSRFVSPSTSTSTSSNTAVDARDPEKAEHYSGHNGTDEERPSATEPMSATEAFESAREGREPLSHVSTVPSAQTMGTAIGQTLTGIEVRQRRTKEGGGPGNVFVVGYEGEMDLMNPHNWSKVTRIGATYAYHYPNFVAAAG